MSATSRLEVRRLRTGFVSEFVFVVHGVIAFVPIAFLVFAVSLILRARFEIGHWPVRGLPPGLDLKDSSGKVIQCDPWPGEFGSHFGIIDWLANLDMKVLAVLGFIHFATLLYCSFSKRFTFPALRTTGLGIISLLIVYVMKALDPFGAWGWLME